MLGSHNEGQKILVIIDRLNVIYIIALNLAFILNLFQMCAIGRFPKPRVFLKMARKLMNIAFLVQSDKRINRLNFNCCIILRQPEMFVIIGQVVLIFETACQHS